MSDNVIILETLDIHGGTSNAVLNLNKMLYFDIDHGMIVFENSNVMLTTDSTVILLEYFKRRS